MALAYIPPGVNVEELFSPSVNPLLATSAQVGLVGLAQGFQTGTLQATFTSGTDAGLPVTGVASTDLLTATGHGYRANDPVKFSAITGGAGITAGTTYFVIASGLTADVFKVSATVGGSAVDFTTNLTAGTVTRQIVPVTVTAPVGSVFTKVDVNNAFEKVRNLLNPVAGVGALGQYFEGTDFSTILSTDATQITITPIIDTDLDTNGGTLGITYHYVPLKYYQATRLDSISAIEDRFGPAFDDSGIVTPLSAAATIAFENGAQSLVVQPLYKLVSNVRAQPVAGEEDDLGTWQTTLQGLRDIEDLNIIIPAYPGGYSTGSQNSIQYAVQDHVRFMALQGEMLICVFGGDNYTQSELQAQAGVLRDRGDEQAESTVMVSPSRFTRRGTNNVTIALGGQYVAAGIGGMISARPVSTPLTRKQLAGFLSVEDARDKSAKNADAGSGLLVVEQKGTILQVRHGLTTDNTSTARRELSVVRAKHRMIESISQTIDTQIIGSVPADGNAPSVVKNAVIGVLESLRQARELVDYAGVQARNVTGDPTTVEVRFSYLPAFPLNYVNVIFSLDLSGGAVTTSFDNTAS